MTHVQLVCDFLETFAPSRLAEDWDNVGLLVGDRDRPVTNVMTCLTVTPASVEEAIQQQVDLIVSHHPFPFHPVKRITADKPTGQMLLRLIAGEVAVYSPHTSFDSAHEGINRQLADGLGLHEIRPLTPIDDDQDQLGAGRYGVLDSPITLLELGNRLKMFLNVDGLHLVGASDRRVSKIAVACGSAGSFLAAARDCGCDTLVTGETTFHTCLEAEATGVALLLPGHYASERFAVERLAEVLAMQFPALSVWPSRRECDPLTWV